MLRDLIVADHKSVMANLTAVQDIPTGCGVVIGEDGVTFDYPAAATAENIFVVNRARYAPELVIKQTVSDWEPEFLTVKTGETGLLYTYYFGEMFATDQFDETLSDASAGTYLQVGTDGKWVQAAGATKYVLQGHTSEIGNDMIIIRAAELVVSASSGTTDDSGGTGE